MKKVALCLKGAISKKGSDHERFYHANELYKDGEYIDFVLVRDSIYEHIVYPNKNYEFDFFLHSWNYDLQDQLKSLYLPKKSYFEDNNNYNGVIQSIISNDSDFGGVSGSLSLKKTLELKEIYEIENNFNYDIVIIYRFDVLIWKNIKLDNYELDKYLYVNAWDGSCNADYHFVMSNKNATKFKYLYDSIYLINNHHKFHHFIKNYLVNILNLEMREDDIKAGLDQEHMRVLGNKNKIK